LKLQNTTASRGNPAWSRLAAGIRRAPGLAWKQCGNSASASPKSSAIASGVATASPMT